MKTLERIDVTQLFKYVKQDTIEMEFDAGIAKYVCEGYEFSEHIVCDLTVISNRRITSGGCLTPDSATDLHHIQIDNLKIYDWNFDVVEITRNEEKEIIKGLKTFLNII